MVLIVGGFTVHGFKVEGYETRFDLFEGIKMDFFNFAMGYCQPDLLPS